MLVTSFQCLLVFLCVCLCQASVYLHSRRLCEEGSLSRANDSKLAAPRNDDKERTSYQSLQICGLATLQACTTARSQICKNYVPSEMHDLRMLCSLALNMLTGQGANLQMSIPAGLQICKLGSAGTETRTSASRARASQGANLQNMFKLLQ